MMSANVILNINLIGDLEGYRENEDFPFGSIDNFVFLLLPIF